ncbi:MAG: cyclopropane-fatty-acyl-phospholipid synthase family protein [Planctomycetota bacterium]|nr:cyclopropane-fatty-acyl-phospholipid synthase family protein [Planctomycetota bacterium]MCX8040647.1 cyclopropane-fatty-acyl-phospholipid synthase family protein [Planctomycetota bacterium]MDW8372790.1 cyclopropane-fatty-acyl-phospholipid synthase family protein [Planctomycetota bacterium]
MNIGIALAERGALPDPLTRLGIRRLLAKRLDERRRHPERRAAFLASLRTAPIAIHQEAANAQHYEVPVGFFRLVLGPRLKYSACYFPSGRETLAEAEEAMLALTAERAQLRDGQRVLEIGCGWGSLTLWMAECFPHSRIDAVSNSVSQRRWIEQQAAARGLGNIRVHTADIAAWQPPERGFDRIVSVECFEHLRNHAALFARLRSWLADDGLVFVHVFCHREDAYPFETDGDDDWMGRHFFTGGMMPSEDLFARYDEDLRVVARWRVDGRHYGRTARCWLRNLDERRAQAEQVLAAAGHPEPQLQAERWRLFFLACEELFNWGRGEEWFVSHQLLAPR